MTNISHKKKLMTNKSLSLRWKELSDSNLGHDFCEPWSCKSLGESASELVPYGDMCDT